MIFAMFLERSEFTAVGEALAPILRCWRGDNSIAPVSDQVKSSAANQTKSRLVGVAEPDRRTFRRLIPRILPA